MTMNVSIVSFSYKKGLPDDSSGNGGGHVFDCRAIPNPGREEKFKTQTGQDQSVIEYLGTIPEAKKFLTSTNDIVSLSVDNYLARSFSHLSVGFGCTGGQHRSVYFAENLARVLREKYGDKITVTLAHRDMPRFT